MIIFMTLFSALAVTTWNFIEQATDPDYNLGDYLYSYATSSRSVLDAISFVSPVVATFMIGISVAMTSSKMGKHLSVFEEHVELQFPRTMSRTSCKNMLEILFYPIL